MSLKFKITKFPKELQRNKPIMSESVEADVLNALAQFEARDKWKQWGMDNLREQGPAVLLEGPSGTGKTTIAKWMANKIKKGFKQLSVAELSGGGSPGETEKAVMSFFADAKKRNWMTVFIDECDHLLGNRADISGDALTWMLGTTETLMMEMNRYRGLIICASNHPKKLDPALSNRFMSIIKVAEPDFEMRIRLWKVKWPAKFPLQIGPPDLRKLAQYELNGRQIETVIVNVASNAIRLKKEPSITMFHLFCEKEKGKHIDE